MKWIGVHVEASWLEKYVVVDQCACVRGQLQAVGAQWRFGRY